MFSIGDNVVYPMHGAGKVVGVEERMFANQPTKYLVLTMLLGGMKVHVPFLSVEKVGLRPVSDKKTVTKIAKVLKDRTGSNLRSITWNRRFAIYLDKMKSGDVLELAEVIRVLSVQDRDKKLSTGEKRLLTNAREILASEICIAKATSLDEAEVWIDKLLA